MTRVIMVTGPREVRIVEKEDVPMGPGLVRVEAHYLGISAGTEMNTYRGGVNADEGRDPETRLFHSDPERARWNYPVSMGYANVGVLTEVGPDVEELEVGQMVYGATPHMTPVVLPASRMRAVPVGRDPRCFLFKILVTTALNIVHHARPAIGDTVVVFGAGVVGLLTVQLLARSGASRIIVFDPIPSRRAMAERMGAHITLDPAEGDPAYRVRDHNSGRGADIVIEVSANEKAVQQAPRVAARQGHVVLAALHSGPVSFHFGQEVHYNSIRFSSAHQTKMPPDMLGTWDTDRREELVEQLLCEMDLLPLITHEFAFEEAARAYETIDRHPEKVIGVVLRCPGADSVATT